MVFAQDRSCSESAAWVIIAMGAWLFGGVALAANETAPRHSVLIFYANETSRAAVRSQNYEKVLAVLRQTGGPQAEYAAASILRDGTRFPKLVHRDIDDLLAAAKRWKFDLAIFSNDMALDGQYLFYDALSDRTDQLKFPEILTTANTILATSPLARPEVFRSALGAVVGRYAQGSLDAVLITDSHGSGLMALIPRVNADLSRPNAEREMAELLASDDNGVPPEWAVLQGTSKLAYWQILNEVGALNGVRFELVFREACASGIRSWQEYAALPRNVGLIAHSAMGELDSEGISYAKIYGNVDPREDWKSVLAKGLQATGVHVSSGRTVWMWVALISFGSLSAIPFFLPIGAWLIWFIAGVLRKRRQATAAIGEPGVAQHSADTASR